MNFIDRSKKIGLLFAGLAVLAGSFLAILNPSQVNAATQVDWVNRGTVKVGDVFFVDINPTDDNLTYVGKPTDLEGCEAKVVFTPPMAGAGRIVNFFHKDGYFNNAAAKAVLYRPSGIRSVNLNLVCDMNSSAAQTENVTVGSLPARKVTFFHEDADTIISYRNGIVFKKSPGNPNLYRRVSEGEPCKDVVYLKEAKANHNNSNADSPWNDDSIVGGSAMLYALRNGGADRKAESYADIMRLTTDPNYTKCGIDNKDIWSNDVYASVFSIDGEDTDALNVQELIAYGIKTDESYYGVSSQDDDAFVIFIGQKAANTVPPGSPGSPATPTNPSQPGGTGSPVEVCQDNDSGLGNIICPMLNGFDSFMQRIYRDLILPLLTVPAITTIDGLQEVWTSMLGIANILFVLIFVVVMFSQASSLGVSNYGIKTLLPKLIAIAILANLSYYVCALLVDISNILAAGVTSLIALSLQNLPQVNAAFDVQGTVTNAFIDAATVSFIGLAVTAQGGLIAAIAALAIPIVMGTLATVLILILRLALIVGFIVFSPIIFMGFILPGTSRMTGRLFSGFMNLLWLGPIIMALVSLNALVSYVISLLLGP